MLFKLKARWNQGAEEQSSAFEHKFHAEPNPNRTCPKWQPAALLARKDSSLSYCGR
jgi:hypothetical protein